MDFILDDLYYDYYNLNRKIGFITDSDFIKLVYYLRNINLEKENSDSILEKYKTDSSKRFAQHVEDTREEDYYVEKEVLHITYPFEETLNRLEVLFETVGKNKWQKIFGFDYETIYNLITFIIIRIVSYNCYYVSDEETKKEYIKSFPYSLNCYLTVEELYNYFPEHREFIDNILNLISIDISTQKKVTDATKLIKYQDRYYLYFIWDFIYNLYDILEQRIIDCVSDKSKYYEKRGKAFEQLCYKKLKDKFPENNILKNVKYNTEDGNHEIDMIIELDKSYIIFECKSGYFNIHDTEDNRDLYNKFRKTFGNGYKTVNDINNYIKNGNNKFYYKNSKEKFEFGFKNKKIYYINISLYNIEYLQTAVQKIDDKFISPVDVYPICWNFIDYLSIIKLIPWNISLFEIYLDRRSTLLNKRKNLTFDVDEIDVFGFLTDPQYFETYEMLLNYSNNNIDERFSISNGIYREELNRMFNEKFITDMMK